jgi:hypothetical protein
MQRCVLCDSHGVTTNYSGDESTVTVTVVADLAVVIRIEVVNDAKTSSWFFELSVLRLDPAINYVNIHTEARLGVAEIVGCGWREVVLVDAVETPMRERSSG